MLKSAIATQRLRLLLGTALTVIGAVMVAGSGMDIHEVGGVFWSYVGAGLALLGLLLAAVASLPAGGRLVPIALVLVGAVVFVAQRGWVGTSEHWRLAGGLALVVAGIYLLARVPLQTTESIDPVHTVRAFLLARRVSLVGRTPPLHLRLISNGAVLTVDLTQSPDGREDMLEVSITAIAARVELKLPRHWIVLPGRLLIGGTTRLEGRFDQVTPIEYLGSSQRDDIRELVSQRSPDLDATATHPYPVVLNVSGVLSFVTFSAG